MADVVVQGHAGGLRRDDATHETADIDGRRVWATAGALAGTIVVAGFMAAGAVALIAVLVGRPLTPSDPVPSRMPSPALQSAPAQDLAVLRAEKRALLSHYAWVDRAHGVVRIPIERAMSLLIARGRAPAK